MAENTTRTRALTLLAALFAFAATMHPLSADAVKVDHLYYLSDFSGTVPYSEVTVRVDRKHGEVYVISGNLVRIYNEAGMEVFWFGDDPAYGRILDLAADETGDLYLLSYDDSSAADTGRPKYSILICDFRGQPRERIVVNDLPPAYSHLLPQLLFIRDGGLLLVSRGQLLAVETDRDGHFRKGYDFAALLELSDDDRKDAEIFGFSVDGPGNMLFTIPVRFRAYRVSPDGAVRSFGKKGSGPGTFSVVSGIAADDYGHYIVSDAQRNAVMVFDEKFRFLTEFGLYGFKPENLVRPRQLAMGNSGKLYVVQLRNRGISVFSVIPD